MYHFEAYRYRTRDKFLLNSSSKLLVFTLLFGMTRYLRFQIRMRSEFSLWIWNWNPYLVHSLNPNQVSLKWSQKSKKMCKVQEFKSWKVSLEMWRLLLELKNPTGLFTIFYPKVWIFLSTMESFQFWSSKAGFIISIWIRNNGLGVLIVLYPQMTQ